MDQKKLRVNSDGFALDAQAFVPHGSGIHPVLCICHGLPQGPRDPSDRGYQMLAERYSSQGFLAVIFNFRGVGESQGNLDIKGWCRDLSAVVDHALHLPGADPSRVNLLGFSAGAAVSIVVAANDQRITAVASCASPAMFTFLSDEGAAHQFVEHLRHIGLIRDPSFPISLKEWMVSWREVSPIDLVDMLSPRPLLLMHGDQDDVVSIKNAHMLFGKAGEPKELLVIPGSGHRLRFDPAAMEAVLQWLERVNRS
ncbi:MAG: alpha/beta fold hydrolase [Dehalococcoidia bacterium]|nr:alpha/beta fold hydrolase [Dehalococcoidia bacterium]